MRNSLLVTETTWKSFLRTYISLPVSPRINHLWDSLSILFWRESSLALILSYWHQDCRFLEIWRPSSILSQFTFPVLFPLCSCVLFTQMVSPHLSWKPSRWSPGGTIKLRVLVIQENGSSAPKWFIMANAFKRPGKGGWLRFSASFLPATTFKLVLKTLFSLKFFLPPTLHCSLWNPSQIWHTLLLLDLLASKLYLPFQNASCMAFVSF